MESNISTSIGAASHAAINQSNDTLKPEFLRVHQAVRVASLSRSRIYEAITDGSLPSISKRKRGAVRGIRLIPYDALVAWVKEGAK